MQRHGFNPVWGTIILHAVWWDQKEKNAGLSSHSLKLFQVIIPDSSAVYPVIWGFMPTSETLTNLPAKTFHSLMTLEAGSLLPTPILTNHGTSVLCRPAGMLDFISSFFPSFSDSCLLTTLIFLERTPPLNPWIQHSNRRPLLSIYFPINPQGHFQGP